jgi:exonuclease III
MNESQLEEIHLQMKQLHIGIVCGQEGRRPTASMTRWDTEELLVAFEDVTDNTSMKKDGNFFVLDSHWKAAFLRGGKQMKRFCPRLVTIRVPLTHTFYKHVYVINAHAPDESKAVGVRRAFRERLDDALHQAQVDDLVILAGDMNACTGTSAN